ERGVQLGDERIEAGTIIWAAGVTAVPLGKALGAETDRGGRVKVNADCSLPGHPEVFVIGDLATLPGPDGTPLPGLAPVAMQQGQAAAANIARAIRGEPLQAFRYNDRGVMATIGRNRAVAVIRGIKLTGFIAWAA